MKKIIILAIALLSLQACSNEFDLTEKWKDITVVYGLLNQSDTAHYVRIEKAFLDPTTSAYTLAQIPDSLYYDNLTVEMEEFLPGGSGGTVYTLQRVDANLEGFQREEGIFAASPNYVYKFKGQLKDNYLYRLIITKAEGEKIKAETYLCPDFAITSPDLTLSPVLNFKYGSNMTFRWQIKPNTAFYTLKVRIYFREAPLSAPNDFTDKFIDWEVDGDRILPVSNNSLVIVTADGENFYREIASQLKEGYRRQFQKIDVLVGAGGEDLYEYLEVARANSGLTGADVLPTYTNLTGGDAYGILSSRHTSVNEGFSLSGISLDSLQNGIHTKKLGFF